MKKLIPLLLLVPSFLCAAGVSVSPAWLHGSAREFVFDHSARRTVSRLDWDVDAPALHLAAETDLSFVGDSYEPFRLRASGYLGRSVGRLRVEDRDWIAGYDPHGRDGWTHWSGADAELRHAWMADARASVDALRDDRAAVWLFLGARFLHSRWEETGNSEYLYPWYGYEPRRGDAPGLGYTQFLWYPFGGMGGEYRLLRRLSVRGEAAFAPYCAGHAHDRHYLRGMRFDDDFGRAGKAWLLSASLRFRLSPRLRLVASCEWDEIPTRNGDSRWCGDEGSGSSRRSAGTSSRRLLASAGAEWAF